SNPGPWGQQSRGYDYSRGYDRDVRHPPQQPTGPWTQQVSAPSAGGSFLHGALGTASDIEIQAREIIKMNERLNRIMAAA
ncbi:ATP-dependent Clp protease proteolytic subunit, partial [Rhizobium ruizarguesonis]